MSARARRELELRRVAYFDGNVETYLHKRAADLPPAVGVLVEYSGDGKEAAHAVALQIAALKAKYLTRDEVPADLVADERRIAEETARNEGKPEQAFRRSSRVDSPASTRTSCCWTSRRCPTTRSPSRPCSTRPRNRHAVRRFEVGQA